MNSAGDTPLGGHELLTRTTLQFDRRIGSSTIAALVEALHRVPGVLNATVDRAQPCVQIAHDGGVPLVALLAAAKGAGAQSNVVGGAPPDAVSVETDAARRFVPNRKLVAAGTLMIVVIGLLEMLLPERPEKHWLLSLIFIALGALFFAGVFTGRRA